MYHTYFNAPTLMGYAYSPGPASPWVFRGCDTGGATTNGITCTGTVLFYAPLEQGPPVLGSLGNTIYYGTSTLYRSTDTGLTHTAVSQTFPGPISAIGIAPTDDGVRLVGGMGGGLFGTVTGTTPLTDFDSSGTIPDVFVARTVIDPTAVSTAYVTLAAFGVTNVWKTTSLVTTPVWTSAAGTGITGLPLVPVNAFIIDPVDSDRLYAGTDIGVYTSPDGGATWSPFGTGLPKVAVFDMALTPGPPAGRKVRIATHGRGMWEIAAMGPTAAPANIGGRVADSRGMGIPGVMVRITSSDGSVNLTARTSPFGYYNFEDVPTGLSYILSASHKRYTFDPASIIYQHQDEAANLNFTGSP
jgi:hypothetical protein